MIPRRVFYLAVVLLTLVVIAGCKPSTPVRNSTGTKSSPLPSPTVALVTSTSPAPTPSPLVWNAPPRSRSVIRLPHQISDPPRDFLRVPKGYRIDLVADGLEHPRWLTVAPNGDLFVVESRLEIRKKKQPNRVTVLRDTDGDGIADTRSVWADDLYLPFGIAFQNGYLYVANTGSVVRWRYHEGDTVATEKPEVVISGVPERGMRQHWTRNILFAPKENRMYLTIGSKENADIEEKLRGTIVAYTLDSEGKPGGSPQVVASGMRNPVGLALHPITGQLWAVVNERDYLGDDLVPDFLTRVTDGGFYGWPYYFIGKNHDPRLPERPDLRAHVLLPDLLLGSHGAPLGLVFSPDGRTAFITRHGSQNRSQKVGYDVVRVAFDKRGNVTGTYHPFVSGWLPDPASKAVYGRPAGLAWAKDGSLLIADDWAGRIWRVRSNQMGF